MKASQVGVSSLGATRVLDHFERLYNFEGYVRAKYDGMCDDLPTKKEFREINAKINYHKSQYDYESAEAANRVKDGMITKTRAFSREFNRLQ